MLSIKPRTSMPVRICVIGAGISGLSTAVQIQNSDLDADVTIVADKFMFETTSAAAAGIWAPHIIPNTPVHLLKRWSDATYHHLKKLYLSDQCSQAGITRLSGYLLFKNDDPHNPRLDPYWKNTVDNFRLLSQDDLKQFPGYHTGIFMTTFLSESAIYMKYLTNKFNSKGGAMRRMCVNKLEELSNEFDIIVNCVGAQARNFNNDKECVPVRGQVVRVKAPWIKHFYCEMDSPYYVIPVINEVVLGGIKQSGRWDTQVDLKDKAEIIENTMKLVPSLKGAEFTEDRVGLRPSRSSVRLEREDILCGNRNIPVIHNYGHAGAGYTLHWGCSQDAAQLVLKAAREIRPQSRL